MKLRVFYQLLIPALLLLMALVGIAIYQAFAAAERAAVRQVEIQIETVADTLAGARYPLNDMVLRQIKAFSGLDLIVWDERVTSTIAIKPELLSELRASLAEPRPAETERPAIELLSPRFVDGESFRVAWTRLPRRPSGGQAEVLLLYPEKRWREIIEEAVRPALLVASIGVLLAIVLIAATSWSFARRLRNVQAHTERIATGDYAPIVISGFRDEINDLCASVNQMASELALLHDKIETAERLRLIDQVSGGLAHQLRNSIAGAKLAVQVHLRELPGEVDTEALEVTLRQLGLLEERLQGYLTLGHQTRGKRTDCELGALVEEIVELFRPRCRHHHIELHWQEPLTRFDLTAERDQLHQLIVNLVDNAIDAAGPDGKVTVSLTLEENASDDAVFLRVTDSGPGPAPEIAEKLFAPFVTAKEGGIGLGLSIAARVAESHGGVIRWYRNEGKTVFEVRLPCRLPKMGMQDRLPGIANDRPHLQTDK